MFIKNLRSEVDDLNLGLEHYYGDFDVVHARLICTGVRCMFYSGFEHCSRKNYPDQRLY